MGVTTGVMLCKWGNSQGLRIPKKMCDLLGIKVGAIETIRCENMRQNHEEVAAA